MTDEYKKQIASFIRYCKKHPVDMHILNKMSIETINKIIDMSKRLCSGDKVYMLLHMRLHSYIFRFKDMESICKIFHRSIYR